MSSPADTSIDWPTAEARRFAELCRAQGLRCRVVRAKHQDTKVHVYRESTDFGKRFRAVLVERDRLGITPFYCIVRVEAECSEGTA